MIKTVNLNKVFRTDEVETTALDNLDFEVKPGEFVAVMGPSGCGKSTLLNILGLLDNPSSGSYFFNGEDVAAYSETQRTHLRKGNIGFVFRNFNQENSSGLPRGHSLINFHLKQAFNSQMIILIQPINK